MGSKTLATPTFSCEFGIMICLFYNMKTVHSGDIPVSYQFGKTKFTILSPGEKKLCCFF